MPVINAKKDFDCVERERDRFMVDLRMIEGRGIDEECRYFNELTQYKEMLKKSSIEMSPNELISDEISSTFVRGVAGVGKTSLVEYITLEWAKGEMFQEIDFLFFLKCRNLIKYKDRKMTIQDLFKDQFQVDMGFLQEVLDGDRVLIILDGLDELPSLEKVLEADSENDLTSILSSLMRKDGELFPGHKLILTGRPYIQSILLKHESHATGRLNIVDITGLSESSIIAYVDNFAEGNEEIKARIINTINENESLKAMASIPQFLSSLCCILTMEAGNMSIQKTTELYVWILVSFIRQHFPEFKEMPYNILKDKRVTSFLTIVSEISYKLLVENKMIFEEGEFDKLHSVDNEIVKKMLDSFLMKIETTFGCLYQFKHLTLQEFLASVYCFENGIDIQELLDHKLYELVAFVAGLARANQYQTDNKQSILSLFVNYCHVDLGWFGMFSRDKRTTTEKLSGTIFSELKRRKLALKSFLSIYYEAFNFGDILSSQDTLVDEIGFVFYQVNQVELLHLIHFVKTMLRELGPVAVSGIRLRIISSNLNVAEMVDLASLCLNFVRFVFVNCTVEAEFLRVMSNAFKHHDEYANLHRISFYGCNLGNEHLMILAEFVPLLEKLELRYNALHCSSISRLAMSVHEYESQHPERSKRLKELVLHDCSLDDEGIKQLCHILPGLQKCDISMNEISCSSVNAIVNCITKNLTTKDGKCCRLEELTLERCGLRDNCVDDLCRIIPVLATIDLSTTTADVSTSALEPFRNDFSEQKIYEIVACIDNAYHQRKLKLKKLLLNCFQFGQRTKRNLTQLESLGIVVSFQGKELAMHQLSIEN